MKRIALVIVAIMLLVFCACGEVETPQATLTIIEQGWDEWRLILPERDLPPILPVTLEDKTPVRRGDEFRGEYWELKIIKITGRGVKVQFDTKGCFKFYTDGPYDWTDTIPFGEEYGITTDSMDGGTTWTFV